MVPTCSYKVGPSVFDDQYNFVNTYTKKIIENGGNPVGLLMADGRLNPDILDICDGFLIPGGSRVWWYIHEILHYAIKNDVPILGICLGSEAMSIYSALLERTDLHHDLTFEDVERLYKELKTENDGKLLNEIPDGSCHPHYGITRDNIDEARHPIRIMQGTLLHDIYQKGEIKVASFHSYDFRFVGNDFMIPAHAMDGVKEAIEYKDPSRFAVGVHFHPELDEDNKIFERLINESTKRHR